MALADLVAQFVDPAAAPTLAAGATFVDHTPGWLKDAAIARFGVHDKQALFAGMAVVLATLCVGLGLLAARSRRLLVAAGSAVAAAGALAALTRPGATASWALPSVIGVLAATALLARVSRSPTRRVDPDPPATDPGGAATVDGRPRRLVLQWAATVGAAGAFETTSRGLDARRGTAPGAFRLPTPASSAPAPLAGPAVTGITPWATGNRDFYRIDTALSLPRIDATRWRLRIHGLVRHEVELSLGELLGLPLIERWITLTCVSNEVGGTLAGNARWLGYPIRELLARAGPLPEADMVLSGSADGWTASTPLTALSDERDALLAVGMNGVALPIEHGFPARLIVPGLYGYVSATKWVTDLELTRFDRATAYWTTRGYSAQAPIRTASRIDVPAPFARIPAGRTAVAGVAWAQQRGIASVQLRIDDGPWHEALLAPGPVADVDTWRQWSYAWDATPGRHTLQVAATDATGVRQPQERRPPRPDGATGWHTTVVQVTA